MPAPIAPSDECIQGEGLVWLIGAMVCVLPLVQLFVSACSGWLH